MDVLCEQSLFSKKRHISIGRANVYPYKKTLHCPVQYEGLKLIKLHWDVDESVKPNSIAVVDESQKLEDIQISLTQEGTQFPEQFEEEVESSCYNTDIDEPITEMNDSNCNYEDEQLAKNRTVKSLPEGIGNARFPKTRRYKCLYCPQVGLIAGRRTMQRAMFHRAHCNHNPHRDQHFEEYRSKTSSRRIRGPQVPPRVPPRVPPTRKSNALIKRWVVVDGDKYACRECVNNGEEFKTWKCKPSVKTHCTLKCKYRDTSTTIFLDRKKYSDGDKWRHRREGKPANRELEGNTDESESEETEQEVNTSAKLQSRKPSKVKNRQLDIKTPKFHEKCRWLKLGVTFRTMVKNK
jgi:hypothetical protein